MLVCQVYGHECFFVRLMDTCSPICQAYGHSQCLSGLWTLAVPFVRLMDTHSALVRFMDICSHVCQVYGHSQCSFVKLMDTHSVCLSGLWTFAVLVCKGYEICSACMSGLWTFAVLVCQAYAPTVLVRLMDICGACQAYIRSACQAYGHL